MVEVAELNLLVSTISVSESDCVVSNVSMIIEVAGKALLFLNITYGLPQAKKSVIWHLIEEREVLIMTEIGNREKFYWMTIFSTLVCAYFVNRLNRV